MKSKYYCIPPPVFLLWFPWYWTISLLVLAAVTFVAFRVIKNKKPRLVLLSATVLLIFAIGFLVRVQGSTSQICFKDNEGYDVCSNTKQSIGAENSNFFTKPIINSSCGD